jgi:hypothetical protein
VPHKLSLLPTLFPPRRLKGFPTQKRQELSKMAPAVARKKRVMLPSDDTTPYASEGFFLFFF